ncbi:MAG: tetratricopeptide repeat protein [Planctomycetaceae bacterium]|nr:tetratricopeptide repeat protein [Planctomycetaceae bacterium]
MDSLDRKQPLLTTLYQAYIQDHNTRAFIEHVTKHYSEGSLIRLTGAVCVETRRGAALALGFVGTYQANNALGCLLKDRDRNVRLITESSLKLIWSRDGSEVQRQKLYAVMRLIAEQEFGEAVSRANILLDEYPGYVEARNQRAIALFALKQFEASIEDSRIVLDLNRYHFGAAIGMGHAYLQLRNEPEAIECFHRALEINPNLDTIRRHLERISQSWTA